MNKNVFSTLKNLDIPVRYQHYTGEADHYITYFTYLEKGEEFADDEEIETGYYIQVNLFGRDGRTMEVLEEKIKEEMKSNNFTRISNWDAPYEKDTKLYHKVFRFYKGGM